MTEDWGSDGGGEPSDRDEADGVPDGDAPADASGNDASDGAPDRDAPTHASGGGRPADGSDDGAPADSAAAVRSDPGPALTLDAVLSVLANRRRRFVLYALADAAHGLAELATLVEEVATLEAAVDGAALRRERYLEVAVDCYHWHLPVLADVGVVDCDGRHGAIRYRDHRTLETWLGRVRRDELARPPG